MNQPSSEARTQHRKETYWLQRQPDNEVRTRLQHRDEEGSQLSAASDWVFIALRARLEGRLGRLRAVIW